jgi:hypothetical protein
MKYEPKVDREKKIQVDMSNYFNNGDHNVSLVVREVRD